MNETERNNTVFITRDNHADQSDISFRDELIKLSAEFDRINHENMLPVARITQLRSLKRLLINRVLTPLHKRMRELRNNSSDDLIIDFTMKEEQTESILEALSAIQWESVGIQQRIDEVLSELED